MATVSFWGGVGITGSSKVLIEDQGWRVLLDMGLDRPQTDLYHHPVSPRPGQELHDRLKVGDAPWIPHLFRKDAVAGTGLAGNSDGKTAVFITHSHVDHIGLTGWIDPDIPIYAAPETARVRHALTVVGEAAKKDPSFELIFAEQVMLEGAPPHIIPMAEAQPVEFGPFQITRYLVDHDVPGASGYIVETASGRVAYTGDIRLHGRHPEWVKRFAQAAYGSEVLVIEGTTLGNKTRDTEHPATEEQVDKTFTDIVEHTRGLMLITLRPRNIERIESFMRIAEKFGRQILWSKEFATFLEAYGLKVWRMDYSPAQLKKIQAHPERYIIQMWPRDIPWVMDLPVGKESVFIQADGDPKLTSPAGRSLQHWLQRYHIPLRTLGTRGHGSPEAIHKIVEWIRPKIVYPLHTHAPELLLPEPPTIRIVPEYGRRYPIG
ncbi:MBL fold metallo-hydrolase [Sulfobacillus thermosulfidooxidans]|nr:MBL fold metallo-hydrolase [Sulfobacillus thermosulfidooxidans]OLZ11000.1 hypothetical protein BFX05_09720 [Sulfobacillus thermosulfidooxidans]OLZ14488.1 hypothetical protein BFX06_09545 [Sulfobacillus thermosulfidooxidans]OLZ19231.1 hypothetical protein BFX07_05940 [Sulfobacillus thermosulfidooxidans]